MTTSIDPRIEALAEACVSDMGDIFWDFDAYGDAARQYTNPHQVALEAIKKAMSGLAGQIDTGIVYPARLREEYQKLIASLPVFPTDRAVISAMVSELVWTERDAHEIVQLARQYGWSVLRNALALAEALDIQDGDAGL